MALSAFNSFCQGMAGGRFPDLAGRDNLWVLLLTLTARKVADLIEREYRRKCGGEFGRSGSGHLRRVASDLPPPDLSAEVTEEAGRMIDILGDPVLKRSR